MLTPSDARYPAVLRESPLMPTPERITALGNMALLQHDTLALFCSERCPGTLILKAHDLAHELKSADVAVIGGFHSSVEQEMFTVLLRGSVPIILCPARSIENMRIRADLRPLLNEGRLLIISPFGESATRSTAALAIYRNQFVAAVARSVLVVYASPEGKLENQCQGWFERGKSITTFQSDYNRNLIRMGAHPIHQIRLGGIAPDHG